MSSRSAALIEQRRVERLLAMTPGERVSLVVRLGEEGLASYMAVQGVDRQTAVARIKATRRLGRRPSACAEAHDH
jgi:hypothetical protein